MSHDDAASGPPYDVAATAPPVVAGPWDPCEHCDAPLDASQRYCVRCGTRRSRAGDPVARHFAAVARTARGVSEPAASRREDRTANLRTAAALVLIPIAAGIGVLAGQSRSSDDRVLAALRAQKAPIVNVGASAVGSPAPASTGAAAVASDFPRARGFAVKLRTLPVDGTSAADVTAAVAALRARGATNVRVVAPADFTVTPRGGADVYVLVSGAFTERAGAARLSKALKRRFPAAAVVHLARVAAPAAGAVAATRATAVAAKPSQRELDESRKALHEITTKVGKSYVQQQRHLPDTIVVP